MSTPPTVAGLSEVAILPASPELSQALAPAAQVPACGPVELIISWLLRVGVWSSISIIVVGLVLLALTDGSALGHSYPGGLEGALKSGLSGQPASIDSYAGELSALRHGDAYGVIMLGLLVLLATPVLRVAVSVIAFLIERDYLYTWITIVVLALLGTGVLLGKAGG